MVRLRLSPVTVRSCYFLISVKLACGAVPGLFTALITTRAIKTARRQYSTAAAPLSSVKNFRNISMLRIIIRTKD